MMLVAFGGGGGGLRRGAGSTLSLVCQYVKELMDHI